VNPAISIEDRKVVVWMLFGDDVVDGIWAIISQEYSWWESREGLSALT
jgi:hypothetical protein